MKKSDLEKKWRERFSAWQNDPILWVADVFGGSITLTAQQTRYFNHLSSLIKYKILASEGAEIPPMLQKYAGRIGVSIMAGRGVGKDFATALTILWFVMVFPDARALATGVTGKHLRNVLWQEMGKLIRMSVKVGTESDAKTYLDEYFEWQTERINVRNDRTKIIEAVTINKSASDSEMAQSISGRHSDFMIIAIDEADGVPTAVMDNLEPTMTGKVNLALMIFNPQTNTSYAVRSHDSEKWVRLKWNAEESEIVSQDFIASYVKYGRDSNLYRVNVIGLPPLADGDSLIPYIWIQDAKGRELDVLDDPVVFGCDVGGSLDKSIICVRQGGKILEFKSTTNRDTMEVADWIARNMDIEDAKVAIIDCIGIGQGVFDQLRRMGYPVRRFKSSESARERDKYFNARSEAYFNLRGFFENRSISIPDDDSLMTQLAAMKSDPARLNKIDDKREIRKRLGFSPDESDAAVQAFYVDINLYRKDTRRFSKINYEGVFLR